MIAKAFAQANACLACGACCAHYRVSFYWAEADDATADGVPADLTERLNAHRCAMRGTQSMTPRCIALEGRIGHAVRCTIHTRRPSPCREFEASWSRGVHEPRCDDARSRWGLAPLTAEDWLPEA